MTETQAKAILQANRAAGPNDPLLQVAEYFAARKAAEESEKVVRWYELDWLLPYGDLLLVAAMGLVGAGVVHAMRVLWPPLELSSVLLVCGGFLWYVVVLMSRASK